MDEPRSEGECVSRLVSLHKLRTQEGVNLGKSARAWLATEMVRGVN